MGRSGVVPRAHAFQTGFPSSEGQGAQPGAVGIASQSCLPRGPDPHAGHRWDRKRRDNYDEIIWREGRKMSHSLVPTSLGTLDSVRMSEIIDSPFTQGY